MSKVSLKLHKKELHLYSSSLKSHAGDRNRAYSSDLQHTQKSSKFNEKEHIPDLLQIRVFIITSKLQT